MAGYSSHILICMVALGLVQPATAQTTSTRTTLVSLSNPSEASALLKLRVDVDALGPGAPTGWISFWDGATRIGDAKLGPAAGAGQATLDAGYFHSCGLTSAGGVKCWGYNRAGQLGDGTSIKKLTAVDVFGLTGGVMAVTAGYYHSCALTAARGVKCWGNNENGQLGDGGAATRFKPVDVVGLTKGAAVVAAGFGHSCALTDAGGVRCWGNNRVGQLGDGTSTNRPTPVPVSGLARDVIALTVGNNHSCALTSGGAVKCWGYNWSGELGDGTTTERHAPAAVVGLTSGVVAVTAGTQHSCALTSEGGVKCWGDNYYGQLGDGTTTTRLTPVDVDGLTKGVKAVSAGYDYTCALTSIGGVKCWGNNARAQLGFGPSGRRTRPVDVPGLAHGVSAIAAAFDHTCATSVSGETLCWGRNDYGQLGDGTTTDRNAPATTQNQTPLIRARAEFVMPPLASGAHWLRAFYRGDPTHATSLGGWRQNVE